MRSHTIAIAAGVAELQMASAAYVWPSPSYDLLEDYYTLQSGAVKHGFVDAISPCSFGTNRPGVQNAAEWIRVAYHDMSTHDTTKGTGGIDASIQFELSRDENEGAAFNNSLGFFSGYYNNHVSMADLIALSVVAATDQCGGPKVDLHVGRVDATEAGPWGVPKPDQNITHHTEIFARQGFNTEEMITMVACGHTLGGVHHEDFPQIVGDPDATVGNTTQFEGNSSAYRFDNNVVTEYLDGTTQNPLVVSLDDTQNSDKRVFGADGNKTARALADPAVFQAKCADIFKRMINTVPAGVELTPMEPIDLKPYIETLALTPEGTINFAGRIRVRLDTPNRDFNDMQIDLIYADRSGAAVSEVIPTTPFRFRGGTSGGLHKATFGFFDFSAAVDAAAGIGSFKVRMTTPSTGAVTEFDNGGGDFPVDDALLYQEEQSCLLEEAADKHTFTVTAAVRKDRAGEPVAADLNYKIDRPQKSFVPELKKQSVMLTRTEKTVGDYEIFQVVVPLYEEAWFAATLDMKLGSGDSAPQLIFKNTNNLQRPCKDL